MLEAIKPVSKAVAGFIAAGIVAWLMKQNIIIEDGLADSLEVVIGAIFVAVAVYLAPKNKV